MWGFASAHYGGPCGLELLVDFGVGLASFLGGVMNYMLSIWFMAPPGDEVGFASGFVGVFGVIR